MSAKVKKPPEKEELSFENAMKSLEDVASELEKEGNSLEDSMKLFEEGIKLYKYCTKKLGEAELRVEKVISDKTPQE